MEYYTAMKRIAVLNSTDGKRAGQFLFTYWCAVLEGKVASERLPFSLVSLGTVKWHIVVGVEQMLAE